MTKSAGFSGPGRSTAPPRSRDRGSRHDGPRGVSGGRWCRRGCGPAAELLYTLHWLVGYIGHVRGLPRAAATEVRRQARLRSPGGPRSVVGGGFRWGFDLEGEPVRQATVRREDAQQYLKLSRSGTTGCGCGASSPVAVALLCCAGWRLPSPRRRWACCLAGGCGWVRWVRRRIGRCWTGRWSRLRAARSPPTSWSGRCGAGLAGINQAMAKNGRAIGFPRRSPATAPAGAPTSTFPPGVTAGDVMERRDKLASGLRPPAGLRVAGGRARRCTPAGWCCGSATRTWPPAANRPWPLAQGRHGGPVQAVPVRHRPARPRGRDGAAVHQRADRVDPRCGQDVACGCRCWPPRWTRTPSCGSSSSRAPATWTRWRKVAHRYASGADDDDDEDGPARAARPAQRVRQARPKSSRACPRRCARRTRSPRSWPAEGPRAAPAGRRPSTSARNCSATRSSARKPGSWPRRSSSSAARWASSCCSPPSAPTPRALPTGVTRERGHAVLPAGHGPDGKRHDPRHVACTRTASGRPCSPAATRASGYLVGASDDPQIVRTYYVDGPAAERITDRARALREAAGTLTGHAAGQSIDTAGQPPGHAAGRHPDRGPGRRTEGVDRDRLRPPGRATPRRSTPAWTPEQLTAALKPYGITTGQVWGTDPTPAKAPTGAASNATTSQRPSRNVTGGRGIPLPPDPGGSLGLAASPARPSTPASNPSVPGQRPSP